MIPKRVPKSIQNLKKVEKRDAEIEIENLCKENAADQQQIRKIIDTGGPRGRFWEAAGGRGERFISEFPDCTSVI